MFVAVQTFMFLSEIITLTRRKTHVRAEKNKQRTRIKPSLRNTTPLTPLTLCTALPFVADGAHTVAISAGAVAATKRVDALRDGDITLGSLPAAVTHTGALVVLAVAAAQHWARRWKNGERKRGRD